MSEEEELEHLRRLAQENSERNHELDTNSAESVLIAFTWTITFILTIIVFRMTSWDESVYLNVIIPTLASIGMARWYRAGARIQRALEKKKMGWNEPESM